MNFVESVPERNRTSRSESAEAVLDEPEGEKLQKYFVAVSLVSRHYGGPEEGGWWYDHTEVVDVRRVFGTSAVLGVLESFRNEYPVKRHNRNSVLGTGDYEFLVCTCDEEIPEDTKGKPRYE